VIGHVALVGMPGSGKTKVGLLVAARMGLKFVDSDAAIVARHGPIADLFARGEAAFREIERKVIGELIDGEPRVIALGGGAFSDPATRALVRRAAMTVFLDAPLDVLIRRVGDGATRPLLAGDPRAALARLHAARAADFALADVRVATARDPHAVAAAVVQACARGPERECVPVGEPEYAVRIGAGLIGQVGAEIAALGFGRVAVVADTNTAAFAPEVMTGLDAAGVAAELITVAVGEASKGWDGLARVCDALAAAKLSRGDAVVALGGGVVGDLSGFAAAVFMRGIAWVQVPTTLLAQVDSSVGGKTAIDIAAGKNLVGAFHDPRLVLADVGVLASLPDREMRSGYAEVAKYGLLGDARFFAWLEENGAPVLARDAGAVRAAVAHCVRMKARIVTADPLEKGVRALLNLGHTFGHALEAETGFGDALTHGEAVALGCALAFRFSVALGVCAADDAARVAAHLGACGLPVRLSDVTAPGGAFTADALLARMLGDKKAGGGRLVLVLARKIGAAYVDPDVDVAAVRAFLVSEGARG
jgi:shikimate kinase/3-dehydroquinate synthase